MARRDPHSYTDDTHAQTERLDWKARVDFETRTLDCEALLTFRSPGSGSLDLDTRELDVRSVSTLEGRPLEYGLAPADPVLGARLRVELPPKTPAIRIAYRTRAGASALQWLEPAQTAGGKAPFLFSQCQAIHARSVVPLQDTPRLRIRFRAELTVPKALRGLVAAAFVEREEQETVAIERYEMPQPIPPYLLAFAVGNLQSRELGPRSRVWAEPEVLEKAAWEFESVDAMLAAGEQLFGAYDWDRFDLLVMPPSFPYGGMENPRLTFLTPTLLAGDRSLVGVVAHELAHSWTGNLITNASAEHFWLNEGWTVYAERRIQEALEGEEITALYAALGRRALERAVERFNGQPELTKLRTELTGIDPDEAFSEIPYEKGYLFLRALEEAAGRERFDAFVRKYVASFCFGSLDTEQFLDFARTELGDVVDAVGVDAWVYGPGIPANAPRPRSTRLEKVESVGARAPEPAEVAAWTPTEWQLYLESLPTPSPQALCEELERRYQLTSRGNMEVLVAWLTLAAESGFAPAIARIEQVLGEVGRMKYLKPLYQALARRPETRELARRCFAKNSAAYHPIARQVISPIVGG